MLDICRVNFLIYFTDIFQTSKTFHLFTIHQYEEHYFRCKKVPGVASLRFGKAIENISHCEELAVIINKRINHFRFKYLMLKYHNM